MIPFFRKIRWRLAANNQFFKYSRYAIGEIVLVVVGILIALYINNWNQEKKEQKKFNQTLAEVEQELMFNIGMSRFFIGEFIRMDSIYQKLFIDSLKFKNYNSLNRLLMFHPVWPARNKSYEQLNQTINLTSKQDSILDKLRWIYGVSKGNIEYLEEEYIEKKENNLEKFKTYDWYNIWVFNNLDDERIINFFSNDPEYLKMAAENFDLSSSYRWALQEYVLMATRVYQDIFHYLNSIKFKHSDSLLYEYNPNDYKHYLGKYDAKWCSVKNYVLDDSIAITIEEDKLFWYGYRPDGPNTRTEIIPFDKYHFIDDRFAGIYYLEFDDQGNIEGIRYSQGPNFILKIKKVR
ncbi:hypothetical protein LCM02_08250 [Lutimonas saemankumensis]|uniref:hypothetical protein n=1 Tax=Lutimonas saemankumensis TaxID=483016 RepID=UPI001CD63847|nr:hypothetical protein [Lutimonas saemankumensis]MCA0932439.1 hypothetical protein [Lutimonas saemankumensis]